MYFNSENARDLSIEMDGNAPGRYDPLGDARNAGKVASARESHEMVGKTKALPSTKRLAKSLFLFRAAAD